MKATALLLLTACLAISTVNCSSIFSSKPEQQNLEPERIAEGDLDSEPVYQPRLFGLWGGAKTEEVKNATVAKDVVGDDDTGISAVLGGNVTLEKLVEVLQNSGNSSFQENLVNLASAFGGNSTVGKIADLLKTSENKTLQENLINVLTNTTLGKLGGSETIKNIIGTLQNPGNKTLQENVLNILTNATLSKFGDNEAIKNIVNVLQNPGNKTIQENLLSAATDVALSKFGDNEAVKNIANVLKNSGNKTLQENLVNVAAEAALSKFGDNEAIKNIANVLKNSGNKTIQENLLNVATEAVLTKFGHNEAVTQIVNVMKNSGNQSVAQNVLTLATDLALSKFKDNAIIKSVANILQSRNGTVQEKLTAAADAALSSTLGPVGAAVAKQGINAVGQALKLGGGFFGGFLKSIGGNSILGKVGDAISGGSNAVGGLMTAVASGPTANTAVAAIEATKTPVDSEKIETAAQVEVAKVEESLKPTGEKVAALSNVVEEGAKVLSEAASEIQSNEKKHDSADVRLKSQISNEVTEPAVDSSAGLSSSAQGTPKKTDIAKTNLLLQSVGFSDAGKSKTTESTTVGATGVSETVSSSATSTVSGGSVNNPVPTSAFAATSSKGVGNQNSLTQGRSNTLNSGSVQRRSYLTSNDLNQNKAESESTTSVPANYQNFMNYLGGNSGSSVSGLNGKPMNLEITTVKIQMGK